MNINSYISFKLTAAGENILLGTDELTPSERIPDKFGYYKIQFWVFCSIFGKHFTLSANQYFIDNEVYFD